MAKKIVIAVVGLLLCGAMVCMVSCKQNETVYQEPAKETESAETTPSEDEIIEDDVASTDETDEEADEVTNQGKQK